MKDKCILPSARNPIDRERIIGAGRVIYIILSRKEEPNYNKLINDLIKDLKAIKEGSVVDYFRNPQDAREFVCITSILNRINLNNIRSDVNLFNQYFKSSGRYIMSPS